MKSAKYHPHARSELIASALFYDERKSGLGERFLRAIEATETSICRHPLWGKPFEAETRKMRVKKFPFVLIYKEFPDFVMVFAVAHFSRKPAYWIKRVG